MLIIMIIITVGESFGACSVCVCVVALDREMSDSER